MPDIEDVIIATFIKNARENLRVELGSYRGHRLASIRVWAERRDGTVVPTRKGISVQLALLPELIKALQEAERLATNAAGEGGQHQAS